MVSRKGKGKMRKSRYKLTKHVRERGKIKIRKWLQTFNPGDYVHIVIDPSVQEGMPHPKFHGRTGIVVGRRGFCYEVKVRDGNKEKLLIIHPVHLKKAQVILNK